MTAVYLPDPGARSAAWDTSQWTHWLADSGIIRTARFDDAPVCSRCRRPQFPDARGTTWDRCWACNKLYSGLFRTVVPIAYSTSHQLTNVIAQAKNYPDQSWARIALASLLDMFLRTHQPCLERRAFGTFDYATVVPSHPSKRGGRDHMKDLLLSVLPHPGWSQLRWEPHMLVKLKPEPAESHRQQVDTELFAINTSLNLAGRRVLLVDDLYTSGSTVASASSALISAGADPPVVVTIGRHLDVYKDQAVMGWAREHIEGRSFDLTVCAVHDLPSPFASYYR